MGVPGASPLGSRSIPLYNVAVTSARVLYTAFDVVPSPKGASTHISAFVEGLAKAGYAVTLITAGSDTLPKQEPYRGATLWRAPDDGNANYLARALAFGDYVMAHVRSSTPYAVAHFRSIWSGFPLAEARACHGYRLLYEVNGLPSIEMAYHYPGLRGAPVVDKIKEREVATLHLADTVICPSQVTRGYLVSLGIPGDKIRVIPNGVDTWAFQARRPAGADEGGTPTILYIGTLADWQGLGTLIEAMPRVLAERPVRLRILGHGRKRQRKLLEKQAYKMGIERDVTVEAPLPHHLVPEAITSAAVCVAPLGYNERNVTQGCCPIKLLEYMACARPIVASNLPVVRELVRPDVEALLFTPDDAHDLARCLLTLLDDFALAERLAQNAAARAGAEFTWQAAQRRLVDVYRELLAVK
jgi:glycosyltransferase involved in cell wall biosynthesis